MVPNGWKIQNLEKIAAITSGGTPSRKKPEYWDGDIPWITTAEVQFCTITDSTEKITLDGLENSSAKLFKPGTLLIAMYGQGKTRGQVAKLGITACTNQACAAIILEKNNDSEFFFQYLSNQYETLRNLANDGSQKNLSAGIVKSFPVHVPPLQEQQKIAEILSTWDKAIEVTEKIINNSQTQKKALIQQLLTGKKRLLDENGVRFSGKWEKVPLSSKIIFSNLKSTKKNEYPIITSSRKGIFLQEDYFKKQVASENNIGYKVVPRDYITYRSMSDDGIFVFNKQTILDTAIISPAYGVFKFINLDASFGLYAINSKHMMGKINTFSQGGTRIALKTSVLSNIKIHIPSLLEQKKIAEVISSADREIELLQAKLEHLKQEKKALMQQLLTGKRRVVIN